MKKLLVSKCFLYFSPNPLSPFSEYLREFRKMFLRTNRLFRGEVNFEKSKSLKYRVRLPLSTTPSLQ
jgi:hypothetical protein